MSTTDHRQPKQPEFSPTVRAVRDAILSFDRDDPTRAQIAQVAGVSVATVKRAVKKLSYAGTLKSEAQFRNNKQVSNSYSVPTSIGDLMPGQNDPAIYITNAEADTEVDPVEDQGSSEYLSLLENRRTGEPQQVALGFAQCGEDQGSREPGGSQGRTRGRYGRWDLIAKTAAQEAPVIEIRDHFVALLVANPKRRRPSPRRLKDFRNAAWRMLNIDRHSLAEILDVIGYAFAHQDRLTYQMDGALDTFNGWDRGLTRLDQVRDFYPEILADMGRKVAGQKMKKPETVPVRSTTTAPKPKAYYYDHGEDSAMEDQVSMLVELFAKTKHRPPSDFDVFDWRRTFAIMLTHHQIPFADIKLVLDALADRRLELDYGRYNAPYHLIDRPGEWENILARVKIAIKRREMVEVTCPTRPTLKNTVRRLCIDDFGPLREQDGAAASVNMADSVADRRRRYEARQRPPQPPHRASNA